tara:strand:- start:84 stop:620 length:537 start_codon:yes stop_codon:yes gene_type:complete
MEKFLNIPVYPLVTNGGPLTSITPTGGAEFEVTSGTFIADVSIGDIVHNGTDDEFYLVAAIASNTQLDLTPLEGAAASIPAAKQVYIHSGTVNNKQLVSIMDIALIEQTTASTCDIHLDTGSTAADLITITHTPVATGSEAVRDLVQTAVTEAYTSSWTNVSHDLLTLPNKVIAINLY